MAGYAYIQLSLNFVHNGFPYYIYKRGGNKLSRNFILPESSPLACNYIQRCNMVDITDPNEPLTLRVIWVRPGYDPFLTRLMIKIF